MSNEPQTDVPWLGIAIAIAIVGAAIVGVLAAADAPPEPPQPRLVRHTPADLGAWQPFVDMGTATDVASAEDLP